MLGRIARHKPALRDHTPPARPPRREDRARQARSDALAGEALRYFRMQEHDAAVLLLIIGDRDVVPDWHLEAMHGRVVDDLVHAATRHATGKRRPRPKRLRVSVGQE